MSFELEPIDIDNLDADTVEARLLRVVDTVEGLGTGLDVRNGFIHDYVLRLKTILWQGVSDKMTQVGNSLSPALASSGATFDSAVLDLAAAGYGLSRYIATSADGTIAIRLDSPRVVLIPRGAIFQTADGRRYVTETAFSAQQSAAELRGPSDRLITRVGNEFEFVIDAVAVQTGAVGRASIGEAVTPSGVAVPGFRSAYIKTAFNNSVDAEDDASLIARLQRQIPTRALSSRASLAAFLTDFSAFPTWRAVSTIGYGDAEMLRGKQAGFCFGGTADSYVRPLDLPNSVTLKKSAIVTQINNEGRAIWQVQIGRNDLPGFYYVAKVAFATGEVLRVEEQQRGFDISEIVGESIPVIMSASDAAFSRFQTMAVTLSSPMNDYEVGDTAELDVTLVGMPDIAEAQTIVSDRAFRFVGGDTVIKAAVPVFVSVGVQIHARPGVLLANADNIRSAVASYFNNAGFAGTLHTSRVATIVHGFLPTGADVASVEAVLETIKPDGTRDRRRVKDEITTPNLPQVSTTARTCVFFCDPANVVVTAYQENAISAV